MKPLLVGSTGSEDLIRHLPKQKPGEFYYLGEGKAAPIKAHRSLIATHELNEIDLLHLAEQAHRQAAADADTAPESDSPAH